MPNKTLQTASETDRARTERLGYVGRVPTGKRDSNAWFTPTGYIEAARRTFGKREFDLDPFSSPEANEVVKARRFFTEEDDAFKQNWTVKSRSKRRTCWMNPPYSGKLCSEAVNRFLDEYEKGSFNEGIFLVNNGTETRWFQRALREATSMCLTDHRIAFWNADGKAVSGNTRGQAFFYFGAHPDEFAREFKEFGHVVRLSGSR